MTLKVTFKFKSSQCHYAQFHNQSKYTCHYIKYISHDYIDCFMVPTVSLYPPSAHTYIPRPLHGPDGFALSTLCMYTDLDSRWYFGICCWSCHIRHCCWAFNKFPKWVVSSQQNIATSEFPGHWENKWCRMLTNYERFQTRCPQSSLVTIRGIQLCRYSSKDELMWTNLQFVLKY